jgi:hypothetical protein
MGMSRKIRPAVKSWRRLAGMTRRMQVVVNLTKEYMGGK